jgi:ribonucleoside-diphosphate reductase alpha chain
MDDSLDSIYYTLDQLGQISKNGGGVGVNISRVRSHGAKIKHIKGASGGVLPWIKLINDTAVAVNQLGSRAGAITVALDVWHKDIEDFLDLQTENGDQRRKSYDVFPQLVVPDLFMRRVENNENWTLFDPHEIREKYGVELAELYGEEFEKFYEKVEKDDSLELKKVVKAKDIFKQYLRVIVETGMPYMCYKDTVNKTNPNKHVGFIGNSNLCTESFSNFSPSKIEPKRLSEDKSKIVQNIEAGYIHTCNLVSLNLALLDSDDVLEDMSRLAVRILDNTIDVSTPPIPESERHNDDYRILGIGALGFADYLAKKGISYGNAGDEADKLFEKVAYFTIDESANLGKERGNYKYFKGSDWEKGIFFGRDGKWYDENSTMPAKWKELREKVKKNGMRNGGLLAIAPNTSSSLLVGSSASVLPIYKKFYIDKASSGVVPIAPPFMDKETFWTYVESQNLDQRKVIEVISKIQKWIDQGISMELLLNIRDFDIRAKDIYQMYFEAWKKGCKTVYYVRSITKTAESKKEECVSCAN